MKQPQQTRINVVGAGVIGLTTALVLQIKGYDVTILAKHFPGDKSPEYTSPYAGARWRTAAPDNDARLQRYDADTFKLFWELAKCKAAEAGIMVVPAFDYFENPTPSQLNPWWKDVVPGFRQLTESKDLPKDAQGGYSYTTVLINPDRYLKWLQSQFVRLGGKMRRAILQELQDAMEDPLVDVVVNCTGVQSSWLANDKNIVPTRGQNVVVRAGHVRRTISMKSADAYTYVIPRSDGTVLLGTTKEEFNTDTKVNKRIAHDIMKRAVKYCPDLTHGKSIDALRVKGHVVGIRPGRIGGPRVDNEFKVSRVGKRVLVTHNYGHDGSGYQSSWGSAKHAAHLVHEGIAALEIESSKIHSLFAARL